MLHRTAIRRALVAVVASTALLALPAAGTVEAASSPKPKSYTSCTALNKVYPSGVGKTKAKDKVSGKSKPVTSFKKSDTVYSYNDGGKNRRKGEKDLDRDNDGIACEKHGGSSTKPATSPKPKSYANCTALNKVYPHGVGKTKAKDKVSGKSKPVTSFKKSDTVYSYNDGGSKRYKGEKDLDRDNDGVACEKR